MMFRLLDQEKVDSAVFDLNNTLKKKYAYPRRRVSKNRTNYRTNNINGKVNTEY